MKSIFLPRCCTINHNERCLDELPLTLVFKLWMFNINCSIVDQIVNSDLKKNIINYLIAITQTEKEHE